MNKPITLRFFDSHTTDKCASLCADMKIKFTVVSEENLPDELVTEPVTPKQKREFMSRWGKMTMEVIN